MGTKLKNAEGSFEKSLEELEKILGELESAQTPLDTLVDRYARAQKCLADCRKMLDGAELKIRQLTKDGETSFSLENE